MKDLRQGVRFKSESVTLVGTPRRCAGVLALENVQGVEFRPSRLELRSATLETWAPAGRAPQLQVKGALKPSGTQQLPVKVKLPPLTPPGIYEAEVVGAEGSTCVVKMLVLEERRARIVPNVLRLAVKRETAVRVSAHVVNQGNVYMTIPNYAALELHSGDGGWPQHVHAAARSAADKGFMAVADAFFKRLAESDPGPARVHVRCGAGELAAGDGRLLELEIEMPKRLKARRAYVGLLQLADARLHLTFQLGAAGDPIDSRPDDVT